MSMPRIKPFLRVYADQALPLVHAIQEHHTTLQEARQSGDREEELHVLGPLGEAYRMLGQLDHAAAHLEAALTLARALERPKAVISNLLRLATTYQYINRHAEAEPLFDEALTLARREGFLVDFVLQHQGKCLAEGGRWDEAIGCFEEALTLRGPKGDEDMIASTIEALEKARRQRP